MKRIKLLLLAFGSWLIGKTGPFPVVAVDKDTDGNVTSIVFSRDETTLKSTASDLLAGRQIP